MSLGALYSAQNSVSELLYSSILVVWSRMMACDTDCRAVDRNLAEAVVSNCSLFIVAICALRLFVCCFFSPLVGVLASFLLRGTTEYVLMEFTVLSLLTISLNTLSYFESDK